MPKLKDIFLITCILSLFLTGCSKQITNPNISMTPEKKVLLIVAPTGFQDKEYSDTKKALLEQGFKTKVASTKLKAKGKFGKELNIDLTLEDIKVDNFEAIVFIGGPGAEIYKTNKKALDIIVKANDSKKILGAICIAPTILAQAGVLKNKKATVWSSSVDNSTIEFLRQKKAEFVDKPVVVDGNIITGNGPSAAYQFGYEIGKTIK